MKKLLSFLVVTFVMAASIFAVGPFKIIGGIGLGASSQTDNINIFNNSYNSKEIGLSVNGDLQLNLMSLALLGDGEIALLIPDSGKSENSLFGDSAFLAGFSVGAGYNIFNEPELVMTVYGLFNYSYKENSVYTDDISVGTLYSASYNIGVGGRFFYIDNTGFGCMLDVNGYIPVNGTVLFAPSAYIAGLLPRTYGSYNTNGINIEVKFCLTFAI